VIELLLQGDRLLHVDMVDQAEAIYRRVVEQDPQNAIAVVGLGRCALARGDEREGHRLMARALEIDPQNDMARRLEARLAEILAARGEPPERPGSVASAPLPGIDLALPAGMARGAPAPGRTRSLLERLLGR
jgi:putative thioredoxin